MNYQKVTHQISEWNQELTEGLTFHTTYDRMVLYCERQTMYDVVTNPIPKSNLFASPTLEQIQEQIERMPSKEKATMYLVFQMTMNACNQLVQDEILSKEFA
jgi:hypothetical protein